MKRVLLGSLSAVALTLGAQGAFAAAHTGDMARVTCAEFLALPAMDQEDHATALTAATAGGDMSGGGSMATGSGSSESMSSAGGDAMSDGVDSMSAGGSGSMESGSSGGTDSMSSDSSSMASDSSGGGTDMASGSSAGSQSPTVVALVTICENTTAAPGGGMDSGASGSGSTAN